MKQIVGNKYLRTYNFLTSNELSVFLKKQDIERITSINDSYGENYFCCIICNSLTDKKLQAFVFSSDESEDNLIFLFWEEHQRSALYIGKKIYLINQNFEINASFDITTPLIGLFLINKDNLLILEEAYLQLINFEGKVIKTEKFDLLDDFSLVDNQLSLFIDGEKKVIELI